MMNTREALVERLNDVCYNETVITMEMKTNPDLGVGMSLDAFVRDVSDDENMIYIDIDEGSFTIDATNVEHDESADYYECYGNDANIIFGFMF